MAWTTILGVACAVFALAAAAAYVWSTRSILRLPRLDDVPAPTLSPLPRLSVVVPACNEEDAIEDAVATLLAQDYPDLEIVVVDDRSTDGTSAIVDAIAAKDSRVVPVHVTSLPDGWLGKVHALHLGAQATTGEWLLFTDADVHHSEGVLRRALEAATAQEVDHLALLPNVETPTFWVEVLVDTFGGGLFLTTRPDRVAEPGDTKALGIGAFNLVRREVFERSPGFEWLRLEIADDTGLALLMLNAGGRSRVLDASSHLSVRWYATAPQMIAGLEKNAFPLVARCRFSRALAAALLWIGITMLPFLGLWPALGVWPICAATFVTQAVCAVVVARHLGRGAGPYLLAPLGNVLMLWTLVRSTFAAWRRGAVVWRGTAYPLPALREGQRVRI